MMRVRAAGSPPRLALSALAESPPRDDEIGRVEIKLSELPPEPLDHWFEVLPPHQQDADRPDKYKRTGGWAGGDRCSRLPSLHVQPDPLPPTPSPAGNPIALTARAGQKLVGKAVQPWNLSVFKPGNSKRRTQQCRLHLRLEYTSFSPEGGCAGGGQEGASAWVQAPPRQPAPPPPLVPTHADVKAALRAQREPWTAGADGAESTEAGRLLKGGVLYIRVLKVGGGVGRWVGGAPAHLHKQLWRCVLDRRPTWSPARGWLAGGALGSRRACAWAGRRRPPPRSRPTLAASTRWTASSSLCWAVTKVRMRGGGGALAASWQ